MKSEVFEIPANPLKGDFEAPSVTTLQLQTDGSLLCGLAFANPVLLRLQPGEGNTFKKVDDLAHEGGFDEDAIAVVNGCRASVSGETTFSLLHEGYLPGFMKGLFGKKIEGRKGEALMDFLMGQGGSAVRHSVVEIQGSNHGGKMQGRRVKEPGILWDTLHIGSFVFGLDSGSVWREPYLNSEKRETLRSDLGPNYSFHRDEEGYFWFMRHTGQLVRLELSDIKAVPTPLKAPDASGLFASSGSGIDGWIYISGGDAKTLFRVRRNPISNEDEMQKVKTFENRISAILAIDEPQISQLLVAVEGATGAQIWGLKLIRPEDAEELPPVPLIEKINEFPEIRCIGSLTTKARPVDPTKLRTPDAGSEEALEAEKKKATVSDSGPVVVWAGEGRLGWGVEKTDRPLRILRLTL